MHVIHKWLKERQALLIELQALCSLRPYHDNNQTVQIATHLQPFCQILVDYLSRGHFEVFAKLNLTAIPQELWQVILNTTQFALTFSDKYSTLTRWDNLESELSDVAEQLAMRFECEDKLIEAAFIPPNTAAYPLPHSNPENQAQALYGR